MKYFILAVKIAIPFVFFAIANISNLLVSNGVAVVAAIVVIAMILFEQVNKSKS